MNEASLQCPTDNKPHMGISHHKNESYHNSQHISSPTSKGPAHNFSGLKDEKSSTEESKVGENGGRERGHSITQNTTQHSNS
jgi:hypothetical protein